MQKFLKDHGKKAAGRDLNNLNIQKTKCETTLKEYKRLWAEMQRFFMLIGDYQSALLCDNDLCPTNPNPFLPRSVCLYLDYKCGTPGSLLRDTEGEEVLDVDDNPILIAGTYQSPSSVNKVHSSICFLHQTLYPDHLADHYTTNCARCIKLNEENYICQPTSTVSPNLADDVDVSADDEEGNVVGNLVVDLHPPRLPFWHSCRRHANKPNLDSKGNVLNHPAVKEHYQAWYRYKIRVHIVQGCGQLEPREARQLRTHLLNDCNPESWMLWTIILFGIRFFLRADEVLNLTVEDFEDSYFPLGKRDPEGNERCLPESG